jgi:hypothetical protein
MTPKLLKICAAWLAIDCLLVSCTPFKGAEPVIPTVQQEKQASFDGNKQDSGIIEVTPAGFVVTPRFVDRYNAMIDMYGKEPEFLPPLARDLGVLAAPDDIAVRHQDRGAVKVMSNQAMTTFVKLNQWRKMGRVPASQQAKPGVVSRVIDAVIQ